MSDSPSVSHPPPHRSGNSGPAHLPAAGTTAPDRFGRPRSVRERRSAILAVAILLAHGILAFTATLGKGPSFDEPLQLAVGYNVWLHGDFRVESANGDLVKRWVTLPYLVSRPHFLTRDNPTWRTGTGYEFGRAFLFGLGNDPDRLLRQARAMHVALGLAAGVVVFLAARALFGPGGGLIAVTLFAFSPETLAFTGIVSTDMSITLTLFASTLCVWRLLHRVTVGWLLVSLTTAGALVLAKPTALVILPVAAVLTLLRLGTRRPLLLLGFGRRWRAQRRAVQAAVFLALAALHSAAGGLALWAHYGFRHAASPEPENRAIALPPPATSDEVPAPMEEIMAFLGEHRWLPEGFLRGVDWLLRSDDGLGGFMNGEWRIGRGFPEFFPFAIWAKTSPALLVLTLIGLGAWAWHLRAPQSAHRAPRFYHAAPLLTLVAVYLVVAVFEDINIGHRHVLPIYPALHVLAGAAALAWTRLRWLRLMVPLALATLIAESAWIRPDYLAYFSPQVGGPAAGYRRLVDSSLDWGMHLPDLKRWLDRHNPGARERVHLAYFGTDSPQRHGIDATLLPGYLPVRPFARYELLPGYYAISASLLQGVHSAAFGPWTHDYERLYRATAENAATFARLSRTAAGRRQLADIAPLSAWNSDYDMFDQLRFARLCAWLRHRGPPADRIGYGIFIWRLDAGDLRSALIDPPVQSVEEPSKLRRYRFFHEPPGAAPDRPSAPEAKADRKVR